MRKPSPVISRFIAEAAVARSHELPSPLRADLFDSVADLLSGKAAHEAKLTAFAIRETDLHQLTLEQLLKSPSK